MLSNKNTVFLGNIPFDVSEETVKSIFRLLGPIKQYLLPLDKDTGLPKGYSFCEFLSEEQAVAAINSLDQQEFNGRKIKVDSARGSKDKATSMDSDEHDEYRISAETKKEIESALKQLTMSEVYDIVSEMKMLIQRDPDHAVNLLRSKPVLAQALLTAQLMLGMAQVSSSAATTASSAVATASSDMADDIGIDSEQAIHELLSLTEDQIKDLPPDQQQQIREYQRMYAHSIK